MFGCLIHGLSSLVVGCAKGDGWGLLGLKEETKKQMGDQKGIYNNTGVWVFLFICESVWFGPVYSISAF